MAQPRRGTFVAFVAAQAFRPSVAAVVPVPEPEAVIAQTGAWERLVHCASLLGYALLCSFCVLLSLVYAADLPWTQPNTAGVPVLNQWAVLYGIFVPAYAGMAVSCYAYVHQLTQSPVGGPQYAQWTLGWCCFVAAVCGGLHAGLLGAGVDLKYTGVDVLVMCLVITANLAGDGQGRRLWAARDHTVKKKNPYVGPSSAAPTTRGKSGPATAATTPWGGVVGTCLHFLPTLSGTFVACLYPWLVIPTFFGGSTAVRFGICLGLHPFLLEAAEAMGRSASSGRVAAQLRRGQFPAAVAEARIVQSSLPPFMIKQLMAYYRRFMLLNMGSPTATLAAVVAASLEEALERGFLVEFDTALRRWRGQPELQAAELRLQRLVWMCDANQSAVAELNAIVVTSLAQILLERHAAVLALGYVAGTPLDVAVVFVQLLLELALEVAVDQVAMWAETEHGVPVTHYFTLVRSSKAFLFHACVAVYTAVLAAHAFLRHPTFLTCASGYVCDCVDQPQYTPWVGSACGNGSAAAQTGNGTANDESLFRNVDGLVLVVAVVTGLAMLALISLSVLFARYRKRAVQVAALADAKVNSQSLADALAFAERENLELKASLANAERIVAKVVQEGGTLLDQFHIAHHRLTLGQVIGEGGRSAASANSKKRKKSPGCSFVVVFVGGSHRFWHRPHGRTRPRRGERDRRGGQDGADHQGGRPLRASLHGRDLREWRKKAKPRCFLLCKRKRQQNAKRNKPDCCVLRFFRLWLRSTTPTW